MTKEKKIIARFHVADCEHNGDLRWGENQVKSLLGSNVVITKTYWDGRDCGTAYIEFEFPLSKLEFVDKKISDKLSFSYVNININDYLSINKLSSSLLWRKYDDLTRKDFLDIISKGRNDYEQGFEKRIMVKLFFEDTKRIDDEIIMSKAVSMLGKNVNVVGYNYARVDGNNFVSVLFTLPYTDIEGKNFKEFGDYCLGHGGWLGKNGIYGELVIVHELMCSGMEYDKFKEVVKKIAAKEELEYKSFSHETITIPYDEYMKNNSVPKSIRRLRNEYWVYVC